MREQFAEFPMDTRDGVKVMTLDGWFLVRGSNLEPIIRIVAEAKSEERAREIIDRVYREVNFSDEHGLRTELRPTNRRSLRARLLLAGDRGRIF